MPDRPPALKGASFERPAAQLLDEDEVEAMEALEKTKKKAAKKTGGY